MAVDGYQSPILSLTNLARVHLNVWGVETTPTGGEMRG
jgi:hypothetical protein